MELHITPALALLCEHHLLDHVSNLTDFTATSVSYDSRKVKSGTLFFCKGNFLPKYLASAKEKGPIANVAEKEYPEAEGLPADRQSTRLNSSHVSISYAVFCLKKKINKFTYLKTD